MIGCRTLLIVIAGLLLTAPLAALAQSRAKPPVIGVISSIPASSSAPPSRSYDAFRQALRGLGYILGADDRARVASGRGAADQLTRAIRTHSQRSRRFDENSKI